ncbi:hypothetical protein CYMTET_15373 [Cymbomonas tetramitiformis]|uniref:SET domain-containing protein n=1 Tax=Cymbomonas tetramitiformis TaxID=36881 RepID=A0AAE0GFL4_9CHLO|nr:hypothetical protein CYMTET_15373 [Cymbomonas tetramitiformis]|eukprot:gene13647-16128_t
MTVEQSCTEEWHVVSHVSDWITNTSGTRLEQVVLEESAQAGTILVSVKKTPDSIVSSPSWDTLQVGTHEHARFGAKALRLNHSNTPNTIINIDSSKVDIVAAADIPAGEMLTFNYNTTEWAMDEPFDDWITGQKVQGFLHLSKTEQKRLLTSNLVAQHIRILAQNSTGD